MVAQGIQKRQTLIVIIDYRAPIDAQAHLVTDVLERMIQEIVGNGLQCLGVGRVDVELFHHAQCDFPEGHRLLDL